VDGVATSVGEMVRPPIKPMQARAVDHLPAPESMPGGACYEAKWDGWRAIIFAAPGSVFLQSRSLKPLTGYFPDLVAAVRDVLPPGACADGEVVIWDAAGERTSFALLQRRLTAGRRLAREAAEHPATLVLFDLLHDGTRPLLRQPLRQRRQRLAALLVNAPPQLLLCPQTTDPEEAQQWLRDLPAAGIEGLVIKASDGVYEPGRTRWLKLRVRATSGAVVGGITGSTADPQTLLLGRFDATGRLRYIGQTVPLNNQQKRQLTRLLAGLPIAEPADHPWPVPLPAGWTGHFGREPLSYQPLPPTITVEINTDNAVETQGCYRHAIRLLRFRSELQ
jgi:ATP-dependent DNA ligase